MLENVLLGLHPRFPGAGILRSLLAVRAGVRQEREARARAMHMLQFIGLAHRAGDRVGDLTLGQQRFVDIARALASDPTLLMLDEPAAGLNDAETGNLAEMLSGLRKSGLSMLIVEHETSISS